MTGRRWTKDGYNPGETEYRHDWDKRPVGTDNHLIFNTGSIKHCEQLHGSQNRCTHTHKGELNMKTGQGGL